MQQIRQKVGGRDQSIKSIEIMKRVLLEETCLAGMIRSEKKKKKKEKGARQEGRMVYERNRQRKEKRLKDDGNVKYKTCNIKSAKGQRGDRGTDPT